MTTQCAQIVEATLAEREETEEVGIQEGEEDKVEEEVEEAEEVEEGRSVKEEE